MQLSGKPLKYFHYPNDKNVTCCVKKYAVISQASRCSLLFMELHVAQKVGEMFGMGSCADRV